MFFCEQNIEGHYRAIDTNCLSVFTEDFLSHTTGWLKNKNAPGRVCYNNICMALRKHLVFLKFLP